MNFLSVFLHPLFYLITIIIPLGYGILGQKIFFRDSFFEADIGTLGFLGFFILLFLNLSIHFFLPINSYISVSILLIGIILFSINLNVIRRNFTNIYSILLVLLYPVSLIFFPNEDFDYYYLPYLTYLESSKIVFGLVNLYDALVSTQNSLYDIYVFFRIPTLVENGFSIVGVSFYFFFLCFIIHKILSCTKKEKLFLFVVFILSIVTFNKLRNIGAAVPAQFLMIICVLISFLLINPQTKKNNLILIFFYFLFAFLLRINAIIILPTVIFSLFTNFKDFFHYVIKYKFFVIFSFLTFILLIIKNLIISGCIIYPIYFSCFENSLEWSASKEKSITKLGSYQSFAKGWMFYSRESLNISDKFVWKNYKKENYKSVEDYSKSSFLFWSKYWIKDHDHKRMLNVFFIGVFCILFILIWNIKNFNYVKNKKNISLKTFNQYSIFLFLLLINMILWFNISPQSRYGGFAVSITLSSFIASYFFVNFFKIKNFVLTPFYILIFIAFFYLDAKNLKRIHHDFFKIENNSIYFPWPNYQNLTANIDYQKENINEVSVYFRKKTNKLYIGDINSNDKYFLLCSNTPFPCTPIRNKICIKNIKYIKGYMFIYHNYSNNKCKNLFQTNMVF